MSVYKTLLKASAENDKVKVALIDPDKKNSKSCLSSQIKYINSNEYSFVFVGGSLMMDSKYNDRIKVLKENTKLPIIGFISSSSQISKYFDAILFLSLASGRNPHYLIGEHVISAPIIYDMKLESIPVGYILIDGGKRSSVEIISNTVPLPMDNHDIIVAHALACQYLGHKMIYLECGSNSSKMADSNLLHVLKKHIKIPIIVGGGVKSENDIDVLSSAGADFVVTGTMIENLFSV